MFDRRLIGVWRSDFSRTKKEIEARRDISPKRRRALLGLIGRLTLRYTRTRCHATLDDHTESLPYRVLARSTDEVVLATPTSFTGEFELIHFEGKNLYWIHVSMAGFREYFRRLPATRGAVRQSRPRTSRVRRPRERRIP